jgi:hypothetical protein
LCARRICQCAAAKPPGFSPAHPVLHRALGFGVLASGPQPRATALAHPARCLHSVCPPESHGFPTGHPQDFCLLNSESAPVRGAGAVTPFTPPCDSYHTKQAQQDPAKKKSTKIAKTFYCFPSPRRSGVGSNGVRDAEGAWAFCPRMQSATGMRLRLDASFSIPLSCTLLIWQARATPAAKTLIANLLRRERDTIVGSGETCGRA